jgi:hypothetical protein
MNLLTEKQVQQYAHQGVAFPVPALTPDEALTFRLACDDLEARLGGRPRTVEVRQMHLHFPWAYTLATHPRILDAAEDLLGPDILVWATELFNKGAGTGTIAVGWHRDRPYLGLQGGATVTAWVALSDSTPSNGCLRAVPDQDRALTRNRTHKELAPPESAVIDVVLRAGELSLHDADVLHGSGPNLSGQARVGFVIRFVTPEARPAHGQPPVLLARGRDLYGHFQTVDPPSPDADPDAAAVALKRSAAEHLDVILKNLHPPRS